MARILTYISDNNITNKDIVLGSDGDNNKKTKNYTIQGLKNFFLSGFEASDQNNVVKSYTLKPIQNPSSVTTALEDAANLINSLSPSIEVKADEIYFFKLERGNKFFVITLKDLGKGFYGANETPITKSNLQVISEKPLVVENVVEDSTTDVIVLNEIAPLNVSEAVNNLNPPVNIQPLAEGFTIFKTSINGQTKSYLYQGNSGLTGFGEAQTNLVDFNLIDQTGFQTGDPIPEYLLEKDEVENDLLLNKDGTEVSAISIPSLAFSDENVSRLKDLVYEEGVISLNRNPSTFEKNLSSGVSIDFNYGLDAKDDNLISADFDGANVTSSPNGSETFTGVKDDISKTFSVVFENTIDNTNRTENKTRNCVAIAPQWKGSSVNNNTFNGESYASLNSSLNKFLQGGAETTITVPAGEYGVFLSNKQNAEIIEEGTGFTLSSSAYTETNVTVSYEDGTPLSLTQYIINTSSGVFTYRIK